VAVALQKGRERLMIYVDDTRPTGISEKVVVLASEANQGAEFTLIGRIFTLYHGEGKRVKEYRYYDGVKDGSRQGRIRTSGGLVEREVQV
jgi:hypothetical protein